MKQITLLRIFDQEHAVWLEQLDGHQLLANILALLTSAYLYLVDNRQQIVYWSQGMEALTGKKSADVLGMPCLPNLVIDAAVAEYRSTIDLFDSVGVPIKLQKSASLFYDKSGAFHGGMGLLTLPSDIIKSTFEPKAAPGTAKQNFYGILSRSPAMQDVFQIIQNAAETEATVLVRGESGSGKELVAQAIHKLSARHDAPFLAINCAALSSNLLESELFGHVRGAFTGAVKDHDGLFQRANGGTLFLDEVAELPLDLQAKLLRVIQERNYIPVGGNHTVNVDVRIVAATHRSLRDEVKNGHFREDLMYRLRVVPIFLPPLRERREDISLLIWHFIGQHNNERVRIIEKIEPQAMKILLDYAWPGNIRELHNVVEYAFAVGRGSTLRLTELPPEFREPKIAELPKLAYRSQTPQTEEEVMAALRHALTESGGRAGEAARLLGMSRATFWRKRKLYQI